MIIVPPGLAELLETGSALLSVGCCCTVIIGLGVGALVLVRQRKAA